MEIMTERLICLDADAGTKEEAIRLLAEKMDKEGRLNDKEEYIKAVLEREKTYPTCIGFSVATPHGKTDAVKTATLAMARLKKPIKWDENEEVDVIFEIAVPLSEAGDRHLQILAAIARKLMHEEFRDDIRKAETGEKVLSLIGQI